MSSPRAKGPYDRRNILILLKAQGVVRSFFNLIDFEVSFLPDSFMPTCNREKPLKDSLLGHFEAFFQF